LVATSDCRPTTRQFKYTDYLTSINAGADGKENGIAPDSIPTTFNIFMDVEIEPGGTQRILPPRGRELVIHAR
jgi:hypothetical protein